MKPKHSNKPQQAGCAPTNCSAIPFDHTKIAEVFQNIRLQRTDGRVLHYLVQTGCNWVDEISFLSPTEMRIQVDNFPGQKLWFASNLPLGTMEDFRRDVERAGLNLIPQNVQGHPSPTTDTPKS